MATDGGGRGGPMLISAEIRWFWPDATPPALHDWFASIGIHGCAVGGGDDDPRPDAYLRDATQQELGIKARAGKTIEVKGLVTVVWNGLRAGPFAGPIEIWTKWTAAALTLDPRTTIETRKRRWLRKFDTGGAIPREIPLNKKETPAGRCGRDGRAQSAIDGNAHRRQLSSMAPAVVSPESMTHRGARRQ
jgi:hypothetical protein